MKVLVVGSGGFIGGWVKKLLIEDNEHDVIDIRGKRLRYYKCKYFG